MNKHQMSVIITSVLLPVIVGLTVFFMQSNVYAADDDRVMVSLGDSYSSGEGIPPFYGSREATKDEDSQEAQDWLAHRSQLSWPGMLKFSKNGDPMSEMKGKQWYFVAASGAKTTHYWEHQDKKYYRKLLSTERALLPPQKDVFNTIKRKNQKVDYVTITIGGNDLGFASIITTAVIHPTYLTREGSKSTLEKNLDDAWDNFNHGVKNRIRLVGAVTFK